MKLYEAIRAGSKLRLKGTGDFITGTSGSLRTCALGAAFEAVHPEGSAIVEEVLKDYEGTNHYVDDYITDRFDLDVKVKLPVFVAYKYESGSGKLQEWDYLKELITILNDNGMSREEIADLLESEYNL